MYGLDKPVTLHASSAGYRQEETSIITGELYKMVEEVQLNLAVPEAKDLKYVVSLGITLLHTAIRKDITVTDPSTGEHQGQVQPTHTRSSSALGTGAGVRSVPPCPLRPLPGEAGAYGLGDLGLPWPPRQSISAIRALRTAAGSRGSRPAIGTVVGLPCLGVPCLGGWDVVVGDVIALPNHASGQPLPEWVAWNCCDQVHDDGTLCTGRCAGRLRALSRAP